MQVLKRTEHTTDYNLGGKNRRRKIGKFINFKNHLGEFAETSPAVGNQPTEPPAWQGSYDFAKASLNAPMQFFARDAMDAGNRAMVGFRKSDEPSVWVNYKAYNIDNAVDVTEIDNQTVQWTNLWTDTNYRVTHYGHGMKTDFVLTGENHPASFTETVKLGAQMTLQDNGDNTISVMKNGEEVFKLPAPFGYVETDELQEPVIRVTMAIGEKVNGLDTIVITPNADDLASVGYAENIVIDPTTTIDDSSIDDNYIKKDLGSNNYGAATGLGIRYAGASIIWKTLIRFDESLIPAGTITDLTMNYTINFVGTAGSPSVYRVADANYNWVEGTANNTSQAGSSCWDYLAYDASTPTSWAGSAGLETSGTDYIADASPPTIDGTSTGAKSTSFGATGASWCEYWRDNANTNGGMLIDPNDGPNVYIAFRATEYATVDDRPSFDIDYGEATADGIMVGINF